MRTTVSTSLVLLLVIGGFLLLSADAYACSVQPRGYLGSRQVFPAGGATAVPTNVQVVVSYTGIAVAITDHLALATASGASVPATVTQPVSESSGYLLHQTFVLTPAAPLAPNTQYQVISDYGTLPCVRNEYWNPGMLGFKPCSAAPDGPVAISTFTTGTGPDTVPPSLSGELSYTSLAQSCDSGACCGPYDGYWVSMTWPAAGDGGGPVYYELSREGAPVLSPAYVTSTGQTSTVEVGGAFLCSGSKTSSFGIVYLPDGTYREVSERFQGQSGTYQVVAVDLAGNRSATLSVNVALACTTPDGGATPIDAIPSVDAQATPADAPITDGPVARLDGSGGPATNVPDAAPVEPARGDHGCSCRLGTGHRASALSALLALGLMLAVARRRSDQ